jgi:molecular chaperone Hsp33
MDDYLIRHMSREAGVRVLACTTARLINVAAQRHQTAPGTTTALGYTLTGGVLLGGLLKVQQRLALKFESDAGLLQKIVVEGNSYGAIRGYAFPPDADRLANSELLPEGAYDVAGLLGDRGTLTVVVDLRVKELYESVVPFAAGNIVDDLNYYLNQSEQIPSFISISLQLNNQGTVSEAAGILIQALPPHNEVMVNELADRLQEMPPLAVLLAGGLALESVVEELMRGYDHQFLEKRPLAFRCDCSRERTLKALISLGREEIEELMRNEGQAEVECQFCREKYVFDELDLEIILDDLTE